MTAGCPSPQDMALRAEGKLPPAEQEALERHASACPECLRALRLLTAGRGVAEAPPLTSSALARALALGASRRASWRWAAAAAFLLGGVGIWLVSRQDPGVPGGERQPALVSSSLRQDFPAGPLGDPRAPSACLAQGAELVLEAGSRVSALGPGRRLRPEAGALWLEVSRGEAATVILPGAAFTLARGALAVSLPQPKPSAWRWFQEAAAGESSETPCAWVLEGQVEAVLGDRKLRLGAGKALRFAGGAWTEGVLTGQELEELWERRALAVAALPGTRLLASPVRLSRAGPSARGSAAMPPAYRWVAVLTGRAPGTEVRLSLPAAGAWFDWAVGLGGRAPRPREVVEVAWDGERLVGRVDGRPVLSLDRERLRTGLIPVDDAGWGVSVWGGSVTVEKDALQEVPR